MTPHKILILLCLVFLKCGLLSVHGDGDDNQNVQVNPQPTFKVDQNMMFLNMDELYVGNIHKIKFDFDDPSTSPHHFLPKEVADSIPFASSELQNILKLFSIPQGSEKAKAMEDTLFKCENTYKKGEVRTCTTSLESIIDFVRSVFGPRAEIKVLANSHTPGSTGTSDEYTMAEVGEIPMRKMVGCHWMRYPYSVYDCHHRFNSKAKVFRVKLVGNRGGDELETYVSCHMDTSTWDQNLQVFDLLNVKPGSSPICHFFPEGDLIWIQPSI
ncbi:BURP domain-containing protein 3-like [Tripterygium wilfordii]|uniref:BURP domain-containing protein 3-like n=1 Tax=Tripterygium wilfordii TaxID=458696 RepID=A0A7J7CAS2_TRIWF|nr:BURP domain protein USPL1-like [Tripterygium wilfordii]KAF5730836.1 BURP domain-containing protein 3-like [Tripterygium wilfordii]